MSWQIDSDRPVYIQLIEEIKMRIISGYYKLGERLPSVRELAEEARVNPNTMQKALSELESCGLLNSQRTSGRYITDNQFLVDELKQIIANQYISEFFEKMEKLGFSKEEIKQQINK
jgi:DNA-binding transcriptional regulator YhcF (GntR family)